MAAATARTFGVTVLPSQFQVRNGTAKGELAVNSK